MTTNNTDNFNELFKKIENALIDSKILKDFDLSKLHFDDINIKTLNNLMSSPNELYIDEETDRIFIIDEGGNKTFCPEPEEGILLSSEWLVDKLPLPTFSLDQGGNVRKSEEAEAIYQIAVLSKIFNDPFKEDMESIIESGYDFNTLSNKNGKSFSELLSEIQDLQSMYINAVLSSCQIKIANTKKKLESFFVELLTPDEITKLSEIDLQRKEINVTFEKNGKGTKDLKGKSKIQVLEIINEREDAYAKLFDSYPYYSKLWKIRHLSSEYIPTITKAKIRRVCEKVVSDAVNEKLINPESWIVKEYTRRSIRKAYKAVLINIKEKEILKCQQLRDKYVVPLKR